LCNAIGQTEKVLTEENQTAGDHHYELDLKNVDAGLYFIRLIAGDHVFSSPMIVEGQ